MIWAHIRIHCVWYWRQINRALWHKLPHVIGLGVVCGGTIIVGARLPEVLDDLSPRCCYETMPRQPIPEPSSVLLLGIGAAALIKLRRR